MMKRALSVLLALMMCLTMLPVEALAEVLIPVVPATEKETPAEPETTAKTVGGCRR